MAQISLFKELLKQVTCEAIPNIGFTQEDLDRVKTCINPVQPTQTEDFSPNITFDTAQTNQADCIAGGTEEVKRIIAEEQRKLPNAIRYASLRGKVQELRDNAEAVQVYFSARYDFYTAVIDTTSPFVSEYLYWDGEYLRLTSQIETVGSAAKTTYLTSLGKTNFIKLILDNLTEIKIASVEVRNNFLSLNDDLTNFTAFLRGFGITSSITHSNRDAILNSPKILELIVLAKAKAASFSNRLVAKANAIKTQSDLIQGLPSLPEIASESQTLIQSEFDKISHQLIAKFINPSQSNDGITSQPVITTNSLGVKFRLINKSFDQVKITQFNDQGVQLDQNGNAVQVDETVQIDASPILSSNVFRDRQGFSIEGIALFREGASGNQPREDSDYAALSGLLYNGISGQSYPGFYRKLSKPIKLLFSLEDRGLTLDADKIDPELKKIQDAPTTIRDDDTTVFIQNVATYERFYDTLPEEYPKRVDNERNVVYPEQIKPALTALETLAKREAAGILRSDPDSPLKLARPTSYTQSAGSQV
jgi:hypothetical protein